MENNAHIVAYVLSELSSVGPSRGEVEGRRGGGGGGGMHFQTMGVSE